MLLICKVIWDRKKICFTRKAGLLLYLNLRFQTPMKCGNRVCKVPEHGPKLHIFLPWVTVTMH